MWTNAEEVIDACIDIPSSRDYSYEEIVPLGGGETSLPVVFLCPTIFNQGAEYITRMACTRYGLTHIVNAQNKYVGDVTFTHPIEINPKDYWVEYIKDYPSAENTGASLQSALVQFLTDWNITGYAVANTIDLMKNALVNCHLIYTGSSNGDWTNVRENKVYRLRTDKAVIGHCFCIIGFNTDGWVAINSYWETNGVFTIPYDLTNTLFTRYAVVDSKDEEMISLYKNKIMQSITIEDAKTAVTDGIWNGERAKEPATREEVAAMIERSLKVPAK